MFGLGVQPRAIPLKHCFRLKIYLKVPDSSQRMRSLGYITLYLY